MTLNLDRAITLHLAGRLAEAEQVYRDALTIDPKAVKALSGLGALLLQTQRLDEADTYLTTVVALQPDDTDALNNLGAAALQGGKFQEARQCYEKVLVLAPGHHQAQANLGVALHKLGLFEESASVFADATATDPNNAETHYNASRTYRALGRLTDSEAAIRKSLELAPGRHDAWINLGVIQETQARYEDAEKSYRSALNIDPKAAAAHHNLAHVLMQTGQLGHGWKEFEWRWKTPEFRIADSFRDLPEWDGNLLIEGTLLVWAEQGVGDQILCAGMFPDLEQAAPNIIVSCSSRLVPLFERSFPFARVVAQSEFIRDTKVREIVTAQISVGSLGQFLRPSNESFPDRSPYLKADANQVQTAKAKYDGIFSTRPRVGVSWRSSNPKSGMSKSLSLQALEPVIAQGEAAWFDLQYGDTSVQRAAFTDATGLEIYSDPDFDPMTDLDGFAAQIASLDLVITVSNSTAHLAGALGVPCWVLLPTGEGLRWYWFLDRGDSPWYPSLRLFRQASPGDWASVVQQVKETHSSFLSS